MSTGERKPGILLAGSRAAVPPDERKGSAFPATRISRAAAPPYWRRSLQINLIARRKGRAFPLIGGRSPVLMKTVAR